MSKIHHNGGIIGVSNIPTISLASGVWDLHAQVEARRSNIWPGGIVTDGLLVYYDAADTNSYPGTGTDIFNLAGASYDGVLTNGPGFNTFSGGSIDMDGSDDSINITGLDLQQDFSLEFWVHQDQLNTFCLGGQGTTATRSGLHMWFISDSSLRFGLYASDLDATGLSVSTNTWYHYVLTYDSTTYEKKIYLNSVLKNSGTGGEYIGSGTFRIGATYSSGGSYGNGRFAQFRMYNKVLSADEITQNYTVTAETFVIQNAFENVGDPLNIFGWVATGVRCTLSADDITGKSSYGGVPLKMVNTVNDPHTGTYNGPAWNIAPAENGQTWKITVEAKASVAVNGEIFIFGVDSAGNFISSSGFAFSAGSISIGTSWAEKSYEFTFNHVDVAFIQCRLDGDTSATAGADGYTQWFDNLRVERTA